MMKETKQVLNDKENFTNKSYWNAYWKEEDRKVVSFYFSEILDKYIEWGNAHSYMEIGGAPGTIMAYLYHKHGMAVSTIDFTDRNITDKFLKEHKVTDYEIYQKDFSEFDIAALKKKYDLVGSWGFIEHFSKEKCELFIEKQKQLVMKEGYLVIELPNIRKLFWLMYYLFNRELIKIHNLEIMDVEYLEGQILKGDEFDIVYGGYYMAINEQNEYFIKHKKQMKICKCFINRARDLKLRNTIKRWFYPYIILIAKRKTRS